MASEIQLSNKKRKSRGGGGGHKSKQMKTKPRGFPGVKGGPKPKIDKQTKRLFQKRARKYNSDSDEEEEEKEGDEIDITEKVEESDEEIDLEENDSDNEDDDDGAVQPGIAKFSEGCNAFKTAFTAITKKNVPEESVLGPVLSGHIKLLAEKLEEDEAERRVKGIAKKQKQLLSEKGHVKPANFLDAHERFLIGVSTKGVVKLFNAVNKAQNAQKGLNPSRFKDAKELGKRKKQAFFTELRKKTSQGTTSTTTDGSDEPAWAPLRDSYLLTNSKLKNWDKMADKTADNDMDNAVSDGSSSDED